MSSTSTSKLSPSTSNPTFTLLLFGPAASFCNETASLTLPAPTTLSALIADLETRYPGIGEKVLKASQLVLNLEYVDVDLWEVVQGRDLGKADALMLRAGDEVAVVPPVSSG